MRSTTLLAGGVGGARLARGLAAVLPPGDLTVVVNVGDDERVYGAHVSADLDTVTYTLAGIEGPHGWGIADDSFTVMEALSELGVDTSFRLGDRDLAVCLTRTMGLDAGTPLSDVTHQICRSLGVTPNILPATDDRLRTRVRTDEAGWLDFQDYFVRRGHRDEVLELEYDGSATALPAPGVVEAIDAADLVLIAPSNPPLSIQPILSVAAIADAVGRRDRVIAVSPLFSGRALKGPADRVLASLGHPPGNAGVVSAYDGLISDLIVDNTDADDAATLDINTLPTDTRFGTLDQAARFAEWLLEAV